MSYESAYSYGKQNWSPTNASYTSSDFLSCCKLHNPIRISVQVLEYKICYFYAPGLKGLPRASSNQILRSSVCNSVRLQSAIIKIGWWYSNQTWTVSSSMGSSHFTDTPRPWDGAGSKCRTHRFLSYFDFIAARASVFHKHMLCNMWSGENLSICELQNFISFVKIGWWFDEQQSRGHGDTWVQVTVARGGHSVRCVSRDGPSRTGP